MYFYTTTAYTTKRSDLLKQKYFDSNIKLDFKGIVQNNKCKTNSKRPNGFNNTSRQNLALSYLTINVEFLGIKMFINYNLRFSIDKLSKFYLILRSHISQKS